MKTYLLPCQCTRELPVTSADAGGAVTCPACGSTVPVPKLRDLGKLREAKPAATTTRSRWTAGHTALLLGALLAATAGLVSRFFRTQPPPAVVDLDDLRRQIAATTYTNAYGFWATELRQRPIAPPPTPEEEVYLYREAVNAMWRRRLLYAGAAALALALTGLLAVVMRSAAERGAGRAP